MTEMRVIDFGRWSGYSLRSSHSSTIGHVGSNRACFHIQLCGCSKRVSRIRAPTAQYERGRRHPVIPKLIPTHEKPPNPQPSLLLTTARLSVSLVLFIRNSKHRLRLRCRREMTPRPNPCPIPPKDDGDRHKDERDAAEKRAGPVHAESVKHVRGEEGEDGAEERAQEGVCCNG